MFLEKENLQCSFFFWVKEVENEGHSYHINPFLINPFTAALLRLTLDIDAQWI